MLGYNVSFYAAVAYWGYFLYAVKLYCGTFCAHPSNLHGDSAFLDVPIPYVVCSATQQNHKKKQCGRLPEQAIAQQSWPPRDRKTARHKPNVITLVIQHRKDMKSRTMILLHNRNWQK